MQLARRPRHAGCRGPWSVADSASFSTGHSSGGVPPTQGPKEAPRDPSWPWSRSGLTQHPSQQATAGAGVPPPRGRRRRPGTRASPGAGQGLLWGPGVPALPLPSAGHSAASCLPSRKAQGVPQKGCVFALDCARLCVPVSVYVVCVGVHLCVVCACVWVLVCMCTRV